MTTRSYWPTAQDIVLCARPQLLLWHVCANADHQKHFSGCCHHPGCLQPCELASQNAGCSSLFCLAMMSHVILLSCFQVMFACVQRSCAKWLSLHSIHHSRACCCTSNLLQMHDDNLPWAQEQSRNIHCNTLSAFWSTASVSPELTRDLMHILAAHTGLCILVILYAMTSSTAVNLFVVVHCWSADCYRCNCSCRPMCHGGLLISLDGAPCFCKLVSKCQQLS